MNVNVNTTFFLHIGYFSSYFNVNRQWNPCGSLSDSISSTSAGLPPVSFVYSQWYLHALELLFIFNKDAVIELFTKRFYFIKINKGGS